MKQLSLKLLLVSLLVFPAILTFAQSLSYLPVQEENYMQENQSTQLKSAKSIFTEDFSSGTFPPDGWTINGDGQYNWSAWNNTFAGGTAPECRFNWYPSFNGNSKLVSPVIATSGYLSLELDFQHFLDDFSGGYNLKVETTSDGGTTWNEAWSVTPTGDIGPETVTVLINNGDVGSDNFQFAITFDGYTNIDGWYFDNIVLIDAEAATFNVTYNVKDVYDDPIEGAEIVMDYNGTMTTDASGQAVFADIVAGTYNYVITASDFLPDSGSVTVIDTDVIVDVVMTAAPTVLLSEDFTAGLCPPANWEVTPVGTGNWVINNDGGNAGGTGPEGKFYYFPPFTGTTRMITPEINTSAFATLELEFKHNLVGASNSDYSLKVETTSDGGTTWNEVWSITPAGSFGAETVTISIENSDVGSPNFQFCLTYASTVPYGAYHYYFDDILLTSTSFGSLVYSVTYNVKDEDENPIEDAQITMGEYGTLSTDALGQAVYNDVIPETYSWDVNAGGAFIDQSGTVTVADDDVVVDVAMETFVPDFPFSEDFSNNTMPPEEWTIVGGGDDNWNTLNSANAGGTAPEAVFAGTPNFNGNSKLVSPVLSTSGISVLMLEFKHYVDDLAGSGYSFKIETTSDGGTTWNEVWSVSPTGNIGPEDVSILIENDDVGSENFQFAFTFDGNTSQVNDWYFDDIHLEAALLSNLIMEEFTTGDPFPPDGWNIPTGSANWGKSASSNAGGEASEIYVGWGPPYYTGTSRLESPTMSTYNYTSLKLQFNHFVWMNATYGYAYKVETSGDGGATWNEVWTITPTVDVEAEVVTLLIDNADVGSDNFKLAMVFEGSTSQINYWYMDNIYLTDGAGSEVYPVTYFVKDADGNPIEGAAVNMEKNGLRYTDPSGQVTYNNVFPGTYACSISGYLFETETIEVTVTDAPVNVDVELGMSLLLLYESFQGVFPPTTWSTFGDGQSAWHKASANNAGGLAYPELMFLPPSTPFTGNSKFVSPVIVTTDYTALFLDFKHTVLDFDESEYSLKVETTSDGGTTWNEVWSISPDGNIIQEAPALFIETADVGSDIFQFAFTFEGNSDQIEKWYIDDVLLSAALAYDAGVVSIDIPDLAISGTVIDPTASVINTGYETVTFDVTFEIIDGSAVYSELITVTDLAPLETEIVTFPAWTAVVGNYVVEVSADLDNDENPANDMLSQTLGVASGLVPKKALYEVFTSSTCPPCPAANEVIDGILDENPGEWTLIKYQMNWPGAGDPYYTAEGGVRRDYYGVSSVPDLYVNSDHISPAGSLTQAIFDQYAAEETALEIDITEASIDEDNIVTVSTDLTSIVGYAEGLTAHIVVVEKLTTGNIGTNGETEFHYVMMKMLPDGSGTTLGALTSGVPVTLTESFDMDDTNMEEPDDLAVIVFVQDDTDKSVVQSAMIDVNGTILTYGNLEGIVTAESGGAIEGATVSIDGLTATSGADGSYSITDILVGTYTVICSASGYNSGSETVEIEDEQTAIVDFVLTESSVIGLVFEDDFESGIDNWEVTGAWGLTDEQSYSPSNSLTDSPGGNYLPNQEIHATMVTGVDLSDPSILSADVNWWMIMDIENGNFDYLYVQVSSDDFASFTQIASFFGEGMLDPWVEYSYPLGAFLGNDNVKVRFHFSSDGGYEVDGCYIDDFSITTSDVDNAAPEIFFDAPFAYEGTADDYVVEAEILDATGVVSAEVIYTVDGVAQPNVIGVNVSGDDWEFTIPMQEAGYQVDFVINAIDSSPASNEASTDTARYIAGEYIGYDNAVVDFYTEVGPDGTGGILGTAVVFTIEDPSRLVYALIRNYMDQSVGANDEMVVHVWSDGGGGPGTDLIDPITIMPEANLVNTRAFTRIDLRDYEAQLGSLEGDVFVGFTVPSGVVRTTISQPGIANRSFQSADGSAWTALTDDYHYRIVLGPEVENLTPAPTDLTAMEDGEDIVLNWVAPNTSSDDAKDFLGYNVYYSFEGSSFDMIAEEITETTFTHVDAAIGGLHTYYVTAFYDEGESFHLTKWIY